MENFDAARIPGEVHDLLRILAANGSEAYLVGGCVRDLLLGRPPKDWDFDVATSAHASEVATLFPHTVPTGLKHGTVTVLMGRLPVEVTTFRSEGVYQDHRRPSEVVFHDDVVRDLGRRDFTCNAMAWSEKEGLLDLFGGWGDMESGFLRTVGNPSERFHEDALRMLRAVRFCCTLGYRPDDALREACGRHSRLLSHVSAERIAAECSKIFLSSFPERLTEFDGTGLLEAAFERVLSAPPVSACPVGASLAASLKAFGPSAEGGYAMLLLQGEVAVSPDAESYPTAKHRLMSGHRLSARSAGESAALAFVAASLSAIALPEDAEPESDVDRPTDAVFVGLRRIAAGLARTAGLSGAEARRLLREGVRLHDALLDVPSGILLRKAGIILRQAHPVTLDELALTGADLVSAGHAPGPALGRIRVRLLETVLPDPSRNTCEVLWAVVRGMV